MIKNYTSNVPVDRTLSRIESILIKHGASNIIKDYSNGKLDSICFSILNPLNSHLLSIRLPANEDAIYKILILESKVKRPRENTFKALKDQASRTAWKLIFDWIEIQMSLIEMKQVDFFKSFCHISGMANRIFITLSKKIILKC